MPDDDRARVDPLGETASLGPAAPGGPAGLLKERYRIERELGRGGIGVVYLARDTQLHDRAVVVKVLLDRSSGHHYFEKKFRQEMEALVRIDHPGVVGALDMGTTPDGRPFLVMQYVDGVTLRDAMASGALTARDWASILRQLGQALTAAHERGVVHRDLKPENVMLQDMGDGERLVKVIDFGIATIREPSEGTQLTEVAGSIAYMAPEQLMGKPTVASDIYALGVIAYEMLAGRRPFQPATPFEMPTLQQKGIETLVSDLRPGLSGEVDKTIAKALSMKGEDRHPRARDLGEELARALSGDVRPDPIHVQETQRFPETARAPVPAIASAGASAAGNLSVAAPVPATASAGAPASDSTPTPLPSAPVAPVVVPTPAPTPVAPVVPALAIVSPPRTGVHPGCLVAAGALALAGIVAVLVWRGIGGSGTTPASPIPAETTAEPVLTYFVTVQKSVGGQPYKEPFRLPGEMLFGPGDRIRLTVSSPQAGWLYLVNEGPQSADALPSYNLLFPSPSANESAARIAAGQEVQIPQESWFAFDEQEGTEKLWMVFASAAVPALEAAKGAANPRDQGALTDPGARRLVRDFLEQHASARPQATRDEAARRTELKGRGDVLVNLVKLEHH